MHEARTMRGVVQAAIVLVVAGLVYLPLLGSRPLDASEGHRVVPGWTMLRTGDWWRMEMFELGYLRKPPGMSWAVATSSALLGETVFAARLPSALAAIALSLLTLVFVRRWLGGAWGMWAGLACALTPLFWAPGRSAEIEMLNLLGTGMLALGLLDLVLDQRGAAARVPVGAITAAGGVIVCAAAKGPASAGVLLGVLAVVGVLAATGRAPRRTLWAAGLATACGLLALVPIGIALNGANAGPDVVRQDVAGDFLWSRERLAGVALLLPLAWLSAAPMSLALVPPLFRRVRRVMGPSDDAIRVSAVCGAAWLASVLLMVVAGVSNARYAMPAAVLLPPVVAAILKWLDRGGSARGPALVVLAGLLTMAAGNLWLSARPTPDQLAGPVAARMLASGLSGGATAIVWADDAIEARPDVLDLLAKAAASDGRRVRVVWAKPRMLAGALPESTRGDAYLLLRTDRDSGEQLRYRTQIERKGLTPVAKASIRTYEFTLFRRIFTPS